METDDPRLGSARRIACVEPCRIEGEQCESSVLWNLSGRGVYVVVSPLLEEGRIVRISFTLPHEERVVHAQARVAWVNPPSRFKGCGMQSSNLPPGCGLEFVAIDRADVELIESHIRRTPVLAARPGE